MRRRGWMKYLSWYLIGAMFIIGVTPRAFAGFSPSEVIFPTFDRPSDLERVRRFLEMKIVRERLKDLGFTPDEIDKRLHQLSDDQLHQMALKIDELRVGGNGWSIAILIVLVAILVLLIIYVTGHRIVLEGGR